MESNSLITWWRAACFIFLGPTEYRKDFLYIGLPQWFYERHWISTKQQQLFHLPWCSQRFGFSFVFSSLFSVQWEKAHDEERKTRLMASYYFCSNATQYAKRDDWISRNSHFKHGELKQNQITIVCGSNRSEKRSAGCTILFKVMCACVCECARTADAARNHKEERNT